jgi:hypothetical protein
VSTPRRSLARRTLLPAAALLALGAAGCGVRDGRVLVGPGSGSPEGPARPGALVGRWSHRVLFEDGLGVIHSSETIWDFRADGSALRTLISRNLTDGVAEATTQVAQWHLQGRTVVITYLPPDGGTVSFDYQILGDTLLLGGREFRRV